MKLAINKRKIETICILVSIILIILMMLLGIISIADSIFKWDILSPNLQKVALLIMYSFGLIIAGCFLLNLMINISIISNSIENIEINTIQNNKANSNE
jgi:hypothetical protein